ncbi:MAG: Rv1355c family protein [Proteobacteria bacterium]|nr:Rv1355c family protein [Pseudomonadota bacterium]
MSSPSHHERLSAVPTLDRDRWQPTILDPSAGEDREQLAALLSRVPGIQIADVLQQQLTELMEVRHPKEKLTGGQAQQLITAHLGGSTQETYGRWVYFPWTEQLVRTLPEPEFREVRLSRNRYKITPEEQDALRQHRIGIVGLSVGYAIATTLAMEGVGGEFRLADFDVMSLSNTNRVPCGVAALGTNKTVIAARRMFELDPYLKIEIYREGLTAENLERFFGHPEPLTLLIEECDDLFMKILLREQARARGVPVLMETNDRGLLDIERFDKEPDRRLLHGLLDGVSATSVRGLTVRQKVPIIFRVLGGTAMSTRLAASLAEIDETITGWSQLGSGTMLGGAVATDVARRLLLGELNESGRFYIDVQNLVADGAGALVNGTAIATEDTTEGGAASEALAAAVGRMTSSHERYGGAPGAISVEDARFLVEMAALAPSGGNRQPWRFHLLADNRIRCVLDTVRAGDSFLDYGLSAAYAACGAALENFCVAAHSLGFTTQVVRFPNAGDPTVAWETQLTQSGSRAERSAALQVLEARCTNRRLGHRTHLTAEEHGALAKSAVSAGAELLLLGDDDTALEALASYIGRVDRFRFFCRRLYREMIEEVRWTPAEAERTRDGIDLATLELDAIDTAGMHLLSKWSTVELMKRIGGRRVEDLGQRTVRASAAIGLLSVPGIAAADYLAGGIAMERVWLEATRLGLAFQPLAVAPYLYARLERGGGEGFDPGEVRELTELRQWHRELFGGTDPRAEVLLFRVGHAPEPRKRSLRRHAEDILLLDLES